MDPVLPKYLPFAPEPSSFEYMQRLTIFGHHGSSHVSCPRHDQYLTNLAAPGMPIAARYGCSDMYWLHQPLRLAPRAPVLAKLLTRQTRVLTR